MMEITTDDYDVINAYATDRLWHDRVSTTEAVNAQKFFAKTIVELFIFDMRLAHKHGWQPNKQGE